MLKDKNCISKIIHSSEDFSSKLQSSNMLWTILALTSVLASATNVHASEENKPKDLLCDICLDIVGDLDEWITSDSTMDEIIHFVEGVGFKIFLSNKIVNCSYSSSAVHLVLFHLSWKLSVLAWWMPTSLISSMDLLMRT